MGFADRCVAMQQGHPHPSVVVMRIPPGDMDTNAMSDLEIFVSMTDTDLWDDVLAPAFGAQSARGAALFAGGRSYLSTLVLCCGNCVLAPGLHDGCPDLLEGQPPRHSSWRLGVCAGSVRAVTWPVAG